MPSDADSSQGYAALFKSAAQQEAHAVRLGCEGRHNNCHREPRLVVQDPKHRAAGRNRIAVLRTMDTGDQVIVKIDARKIWNHTGVIVKAGETYGFTATGRWVDWFIPHNPNGDPSASWYMRFVQRWRRVKDANWFALIGAVNNDKATAFVIGDGGVHKMTGSGELTCFANDIIWLYWNNHGQIELLVSRIR